jgi:hypothetical protein
MALLLPALLCLTASSDAETLVRHDFTFQFAEQRFGVQQREYILGTHSSGTWIEIYLGRLGGWSCSNEVGVLLLMIGLAGLMIVILLFRSAFLSIKYH